MFAQSRLSALLVRRSANSVLAVLVVLIGITLTALAARARWGTSAPTGVSGNVVVQPTPASSGYVQRARLLPQLRYALNELGDRMEKPGKERLVLTGSLRRQTNASAIPFRLFLELPGRMRLEEQGGQPRVTGFNGNTGWVVGAESKEADQIIETLVFDSAEHFFQSQVQGFATRALGSHFRLDSSRNPNSTGPFYDIYQVGDRIGIGGAVRVQPKLFLINSNTLLLERVRYQTDRDGKRTKVEVLLGDWRKSNEQNVQTSITRLENGVAALTMTVNSVVVSPKQADGIFEPPQTR